METQIPVKVPFNRAEYSRNYQRMKYNTDPVFKANQLLHVKKLYQKNKELLLEYKNQLKVKEISTNNT